MFDNLVVNRIDGAGVTTVIQTVDCDTAYSVCFDSMNSMNHSIVNCRTVRYVDKELIDVIQYISANSTKEKPRY